MQGLLNTCTKFKKFNNTGTLDSIYFMTQNNFKMAFWVKMQNICHIYGMLL